MNTVIMLLLAFKNIPLRQITCTKASAVIIVESDELRSAGDLEDMLEGIGVVELLACALRSYCA